MKLKFLAAAPAIGLLIGTPFLNNVSFSLFGFPIILVWEVFCTIMTSLILWLIFRSEQAALRTEDNASEQSEMDVA